MVRDAPFLFCVDGSERAGLGHVSRCSALGEELAARGVRPLFAGDYAPAAREIIARAGGELVRIPQGEALASLAEAHRATAIVVDGYEFDTAFVERVGPSETGRPLVVIDDFARLSSYPERAIIVNSTIRARELEYRGNALRILRGPRYLLIRRAIRALRAGRRADGLAMGRRILVSLGNRKWARVAIRIALAVQDVTPGIQVRVVGSPQPSVAERSTGVEMFPATATLARHFEWADSCITGGGLTKYEACYLGVPTAVIARTPEEEWDTAGFRSKGLAVVLGDLSGEEALADGLHALISDQRQRRALADACGATFTPDCTDMASATIVDEVDRFWEGVAVGTG